MTPARDERRLRVAVVAQRYGLEVNGGAELHARLVAERIADEVDVTVLTTCALDYLTWADHYPPGESDVNGVRVLRFPVAEPRDPAFFDELSAAAFEEPGDVELGRAWLDAQGPNAPTLFEHLRAEGHTYDAIAFVTYLYATTAAGLPLVADRSILVPTMHDEPPLKLRVFDTVFDDARLFLFNTHEERELARARFGVEDERAWIVGVGVEEPPPSDPERFSRQTGLTGEYVVYVGRLDLSKGVDGLIENHTRYRARQPEGADLVLIGGGELELPEEPWLHPLGFVSDQVKHDALAGAAVVVLPSPYESLSLVQLEAWMHGRPTLANATSPVLVEQSRRAGGGLWYRDGDEYAAMLDFLLRSQPLGEALGRQGRRHARREYAWDRVKAQWLAALEQVARNTKPQTATDRVS
jgi:glycosyltransferase involved in cell wall biosynthesis